MASAAAGGLVSIRGPSHAARAFLRMVDETTLPYLLDPPLRRRSPGDWICRDSNPLRPRFRPAGP